MASNDSNQELQSHQVNSSSATDDSISPYEGKRMKVLRSVMNKTVASFTSNLKLIKSLSNINTTLLDEFHRKIIKQLQENIESELELLYQEENLESLLNKLDRLTAENPARPGAPVWRPSGNVRADTLAVVVGLKQDKLEVLKRTLTDLEAQNKRLRENVQRMDRQLLRKQETIDDAAKNLEQIVETVNQILTSMQTQEK